jgi:hypothetical protein
MIAMIGLQCISCCMFVFVGDVAVRTACLHIHKIFSYAPLLLPQLLLQALLLHMSAINHNVLDVVAVAAVDVNTQHHHLVLTHLTTKRTQYYISPSTNCPRLRVVRTGPPSGCNPSAGNSPDTLISVNVCGPDFCCSASSAVGLAIKHDCHPAVAAASMSLV